MSGSDDDVLINAKLNAWANSTRDFCPRHPVDGRGNHKTTFIVFPDGSTRPIVRLLADGARQREGIIIHHYLRFFAKYVQNSEVGIYFAGRDEPWDITVQINKNQQFNLEITALAEDASSYAVIARDQEYKALAKQNRVTSVELDRVAKWFGPDAVPESNYIDADLTNPLTPTENRIVVSNVNPPSESWSDLILNLVSKKGEKNHPGKDSTAVIIDNQTSLLTKAEFMLIQGDLSDSLQNQPFPEVFFYTGFCSDSRGMDASFSIIPLKISDAMRECLIRSRLLTGNLGKPYDEFLFDDGHA